MHRQAEGLFASTPITTDRSAYELWLSTQHAWFTAMLGQPATADPSLERWTAAIRQRLGWLASDTASSVEAIVDPDASDAVESNETSGRSRGAGICYVVLGSAVGGGLIRQSIARKTGTDDWPTHYLDGLDQPEQREVWSDFTGWLDDPATGLVPAVTIDGAGFAFEQFAAVAKPIVDAESSAASQGVKP